MNYRSVVGKCILAALGLPFLAGGAAGQQQSLREQLIGTWTVVSWEQKKGNGTKLELYWRKSSRHRLF
jgi:hypothetical protein